MPRNLRFLPETELVLGDAARPICRPDTLYVFCDMSDPAARGRLSAAASDRENVLDIDHHLGNSLFGTLNFVLETECSTGTVVMHLLRGARRAGGRRDRDLHAGHDHDRYRRLHALEHDARRARTLGRADALAARTRKRSPKRSFCASASRRRSCSGESSTRCSFAHDGRYCYSYVDDAMLAPDRRRRRRYRRHGQHAARPGRR